MAEILHLCAQAPQQGQHIFAYSVRLRRTCAVWWRELLDPVNWSGWWGLLGVSRARSFVSLLAMFGALRDSLDPSDMAHLCLTLSWDHHRTPIKGTTGIQRDHDTTSW